MESDLGPYFRRDDTWRELLDELYEFKRAHGSPVAVRFVKKGQASVQCDECGEETVPGDGGSCQLCGHWQEVENLT